MSAWPIAELLPHSGAMILLDAVQRFDHESIQCIRQLDPGGLFQRADGSLPAWAGIELMAQAVAAWAGCQARQAGTPVRLGLLLGSRDYRCDGANFPANARLQISATRAFHDEHGMAVFACRIAGGGRCAEARLNVFSPPDAAAFFDQLAQESTL